MTAYATIAGQAFTHLAIPADVTSGAIDNSEVMLGSDCMIALAEVDGAPAAGALVVLVGSEPNGYVGWVACLDAARGRGLGDVVTRAVTNEAFAAAPGSSRWKRRSSGSRRTHEWAIARSIATWT